MTNPENTLIAREPDGRWVKGAASPNPGGRAKGFAALIRERSNDGQTLVDFAFRVVEGETIDGEKPNLKIRMQAAQWLADRGWGRPVQGVVHAGTGMSATGMLAMANERYGDWTTEELQAFVEEERRAKAFRERKVIEGESHPVGVLKSATDAGDEAS